MRHALVLVAVAGLASRLHAQTPAGAEEASRLDQARSLLEPATRTPGSFGAAAFFHLARLQARAGDEDKAFAALEKATAWGFAQVEMLDDQGDLAPLRDDPRFKSVSAQADRNARPCVYRPEARQFDFWVGDWDVTTGGAPAGTSRVEKILGDCVIFENWTGANGYVDKSSTCTTRRGSAGSRPGSTVRAWSVSFDGLYTRKKSVP